LKQIDVARKADIAIKSEKKTANSSTWQTPLVFMSILKVSGNTPILLSVNPIREKWVK
jgi:hypothetical protein